MFDQTAANLLFVLYKIMQINGLRIMLSSLVFTRGEEFINKKIYIYINRLIPCKSEISTFFGLHTRRYVRISGSVLFLHISNTISTMILRRGKKKIDVMLCDL